MVATAADPGREFAFITVLDFVTRGSTNWRYRFEPENGGKAVTESCEITKVDPLYIRTGAAIAGRSHGKVQDMNQPRARLKKVVA